jgi:Flp pilus assembly protein TadB
MDDLAYGVRITIKLICFAMSRYDKHRERCIVYFPEALIPVLDTLSAGCATLAALNPIGPR